MALLTRQDASGLTGAAITFTSAAGGGDTLAGGQGVHLHVINGDGSPINVTITTPDVVDGDLAVADRVIAVAAGAHRIIPIPRRYNNGSGIASVAYSAVTSVTVAAVRGSVAA
ncbi:MAG: hypothetical protein AB7G23_20350 [Vicinamibacterales bacterium]